MSFLAKISFLLILSVSVAWAESPSSSKLSDELERQLIFSNQDDEELKVLVLYESVQNKAVQNLRGSQFIKFLKKQNAMIENEVLKSQVSVLNHQESLWLINGSVIQLNRSQIFELSQHPLVKSISLLNRQPELMITESHEVLEPQAASGYTYGLEKLNVPALRGKYIGLEGQGVSVGIIDTGIDATHPDLVNKLKAFKDFSTKKSETPLDDHGHGSHVAGTIAGGSESGTAIGVAPKVQLVVAKAFDAGGRTSEQALLSSLQWMMDPDGNPETDDAPQVISNSWGLGGSLEKKDPATDPYCIAVANIKKAGIVPVFASGNSGPTASSVSVPAACPEALSVGATDEKDNLANFSSRGPAKWKTVSLIKPEISAPGVNIYSVKKGGGYVNNSGTSMATPHIAGVMAILVQANPEATPDQLIQALVKGSTDLGSPGQDNQFGFGRADLLKSVGFLKNL